MQSWAASVLLWASTSAGRCSFSMVAAIVIVLPVPVAPSRVTPRAPASTASAMPVDRSGLIGGRRVDRVELEGRHRDQRTLRDRSDGTLRRERRRARRRSLARVYRHVTVVTMRAWPSRTVRGSSPRSPPTRWSPRRRSAVSRSSASWDCSTSPRSDWARSSARGSSSSSARRSASTGPAIILAFVLAGLTCAFSALSYAEMASTIPVSGSAYTYSYATMGELRRVDHRLGPDPRVRRVRRRRRGRLGRLPQRALRHGVRLHAARRRSPSRRARAARSTCRRRSSCSPSPGVLILGIRETRAGQHGHGLRSSSAC